MLSVIPASKWCPPCARHAPAMRPYWKWNTVHENVTFPFIWHLQTKGGPPPGNSCRFGKGSTRFANQSPRIRRVSPDEVASWRDFIDVHFSCQPATSSGVQGGGVVGTSGKSSGNSAFLKDCLHRLAALWNSFATAPQNSFGRPLQDHSNFAL